MKFIIIRLLLSDIKLILIALVRKNNEKCAVDNSNFNKRTRYSQIGPHWYKKADIVKYFAETVLRNYGSIFKALTFYAYSIKL